MCARVRTPALRTHITRTGELAPGCGCLHAAVCTRARTDRGRRVYTRGWGGIRELSSHANSRQPLIFHFIPIFVPSRVSLSAVRAPALSSLSPICRRAHHRLYAQHAHPPLEGGYISSPPHSCRDFFSSSVATPRVYTPQPSDRNAILLEIAQAHDANPHTHTEP